MDDEATAMDRFMEAYFASMEVRALVAGLAICAGSLIGLLPQL